MATGPDRPVELLGDPASEPRVNQLIKVAQFDPHIIFFAFGSSLCSLKFIILLAINYLVWFVR